MSSCLIARCTTLIFDIGDVLYTWSPQTPTPISPRTLRNIISSSTWSQYECGKLTQAACYSRISAEHAVDSEAVCRAFEHARDSLQPNRELISFIRSLKTEAGSNLRIFAMSNISQPDYEDLRDRNSIDWSIFERVFTSAEAGMRKPDLCFYKHVLAETGSEPSSTAFVDDKAENVLSARSLGMHGVVYENLVDARTAIRYLVGDPVSRGWEFLRIHAGQHESVTDSGLAVGENFAQLLILEATNKQELVNLSGISTLGKVNFFKGKPMLTTSEFPFDLDTTSLALTILEPKCEVVNSVMEEMLQYCNDDGIVLTYFDHSRSRMDPVVCVNVLTLFHSRNRGADLVPTQNWILDVLKHRAYLDGTRYYKTPEAFLYFLTRLLHTTSEEEVHHLIRPLLQERLQERVGAPGDALALAMRVVACARVDICNAVDLRNLLTMQLEDGSWGPGAMYRYGSADISLGNFGLATALTIQAIQAIQAMDK